MGVQRDGFSPSASARGHPDLSRLKTVMKSPVIFDGRNVFDP
ncbi:hypothetical protein [Vitiosangium sp. GDMCC 1.1324]|nr:hypothetical protein [Vitiosangium sp. GDMCC 1.1324]